MCELWARLDSTREKATRGGYPRAAEKDGSLTRPAIVRVNADGTRTVLAWFKSLEDAIDRLGNYGEPGKVEAVMWEVSR